MACVLDERKRKWQKVWVRWKRIGRVTGGASGRVKTYEAYT